MPSAGKRALALLLCLTTLSALSGCMSAELVTSQLTETVLPLPTPTLEATPTAFQTAAPTAAASEAVVATPTPLPPEPSPTQSPVPATPEASQPEATPAKTPAPAASTAAPMQEDPVIPAIPTAKEAMSAFSGHCLNELEEIASMRAELGVRDARSGKDSVIHFWRAGDGFAATYPCMDGEFFARYNEDLERVSCFYAPYPDGSAVKVPTIWHSYANEDGGWTLIALEVRLEEVEDLPRAAGFDPEDFGELVDVLCTVSGSGELQTREFILPARSVCYLDEERLCVYADEEREDVFWIDWRANETIYLQDIPDASVYYMDDDIVVWREAQQKLENGNIREQMVASTPDGERLWQLSVWKGESQVGRMADGTYYMTDISIEESDLLGDHPDGAVYFFSGKEPPELGYDQGKVYTAIHREIRDSYERENYNIAAYHGFDVEFLTPTRFQVIFSPYIRYLGENKDFGMDGEYIEVDDYICVFDVEM